MQFREPIELEKARHTYRESMATTADLDIRIAANSARADRLERERQAAATRAGEAFDVIKRLEAEGGDDFAVGGTVNVRVGNPVGSPAIGDDTAAKLSAMIRRRDEIQADPPANTSGRKVIVDDGLSPDEQAGLMAAAETPSP